MKFGLLPTDATCIWTLFRDDSSISISVLGRSESEDGHVVHIGEILPRRPSVGGLDGGLVVQFIGGQQDSMGHHRNHHRSMF